MLNKIFVSAVLTVTLSVSNDAQETRWIEGMWSDPPVSFIGALCGAACSDTAIGALNELIDDPNNDTRPFDDLLRQAMARQQTYIRERLLVDVAKSYPPDPADDPSFLNCEPYHGSRQIFSRHQLQVSALGRDRFEFRYGEGDQRRTVYMDGRQKPLDDMPTRLGFSVGHWEENALLIETSGFAAGWGPMGLPVSEQLRIAERYTRDEDDGALWLTATLTDPKTFREPLVLKRLWRWAPESEIFPAADCEKPTSIRRRAEIRDGR